MRSLMVIVMLAYARALRAPAPAAAPRLRPRAAVDNDAPASDAVVVPRLIDSAHPLFNKKLRVDGVALNRGGTARHASLPCFAEPGDPYGQKLPYVLAHDDRITCLEFVDYTGQSWVLHEVDETARGLTKDGRPPRDGAYLAWSFMDFQGHKWLVEDAAGDDGES